MRPVGDCFKGCTGSMLLQCVSHFHGHMHCLCPSSKSLRFYLCEKFWFLVHAFVRHECVRSVAYLRDIRSKCLLKFCCSNNSHFVCETKFLNQNLRVVFADFLQRILGTLHVLYYSFCHLHSITVRLMAVFMDTCLHPITPAVSCVSKLLSCCLTPISLHVFNIPNPTIDCTVLLLEFFPSNKGYLPLVWQIIPTLPHVD